MTEKYDFVARDSKQPPDLASACWNRILLFHTEVLLRLSYFDVL